MASNLNLVRLCERLCLCDNNNGQVCTDTLPCAAPSIPGVSPSTLICSHFLRPLDIFSSNAVFYLLSLFFAEHVEIFQSHWWQGQKFLHVTSQPPRTLNTLEDEGDSNFAKYHNTHSQNNVIKNVLQRYTAQHRCIFQALFYHKPHFPVLSTLRAQSPCLSELYWSCACTDELTCNEVGKLTGQA